MDARLAGIRLPGLGLYGSPYSSPNFPSYLPYGPATAASSPPALYPSMTPGESTDAWPAGLSQVAAAYYDPAMTAHYGYGFGHMGIGDGVRRKNATRETTSTLKAWLNDHRKNPYPTKGEKIMLAIITKMTLTQVSTWFANARRRLKKENKMTWSPRNRCEDDDEEEEEDVGSPVDNHQHSHRSHSRASSSTPMTSLDNLTSRNFELRQSTSRNDATGSNSNAETGLRETKDNSSRISPNDHKDQGKKSEERAMHLQEGEQSRLDESKALSPFAHFSSQGTHPCVNQDSTSSFGAIPPSISSSLQSTIARSTIPFSTPISHLPGASPSIGMMHHGVPEHLSQAAAAASVLAASRGHPIPPHMMTALREQIHYQQALQGFHLNPFMKPAADGSKSSSNPNSSNASSSYFSTQDSSSCPAEEQKRSSASQDKPKIWSIANVATSGNSPEHLSQENLLKNKSKDITIRSWVDNVMQQNLALASSRQFNTSSGLTQQQIRHLASGINMSSVNSAIPLNGFSQQFQDLAGLMSSQEKKKEDFKELRKSPQPSNVIQSADERSSSSESQPSEEVAVATTEKDTTTRFVSSPNNSQGGENVMKEAT